MHEIRIKNLLESDNETKTILRKLIYQIEEDRNRKTDSSNNEKANDTPHGNPTSTPLFNGWYEEYTRSNRWRLAEWDNDTLDELCILWQQLSEQEKIEESVSAANIN